MNPTHPVFESWYAPGGQGSGPGSDPAYTVRWRSFLEGFVRGSGARSVLDFGCGDWQFSKFTDWGAADYHGVDVVGGLIARLQKEHTRPGIRFSVVDPLDPDLPASDLLVTKDVLQHLSNADVLRILPKFRASKLWLLVNDLPEAPVAENRDIPTPGYRPIDFTKPPFNLKGEVVFRFGTPWNKVAFLVRNMA